MCVQFSLSSLVLFAFPHLRPPGFFGAAVPESAPGAAASTADDSDGEGWFSFNSSGSEDKKRRQGVMTKWVYLTKIFPCGAATGLDIGLGNMSLKFITLAFYSTTVSSTDVR